MTRLSFSKKDRSTGDFAMLTGMIIRWTECMHGVSALRETLGLIAQITGAEIVHLHRDCLETGQQRTVASFDKFAGTEKRPLVHALGAALIDTDPRAIIPGTLWSLRELEPVQQDKLAPRILNWMNDRGLRDVIVIPLGIDGCILDVLELYTHQSRFAHSSQIDLLARVTSNVWMRRKPGHIEGLLKKSPVIRGHSGTADGTLDPMSSANPWGLTAAEMRICALVRDGLSPTEIPEHTSLALSTVRSHLRSVYAKVQVTGHVELVRRLLLINQPDATVADGSFITRQRYLRPRRGARTAERQAI